MANVLAKSSNNVSQRERHPWTLRSLGLDLRRTRTLSGRRAPRSAIVVFINVDAGWWVFPVFAIGPTSRSSPASARWVARARADAARAVPVYNALHRIWGPLALGSCGSGPAPARVARRIARLGLHICFDRALGYGLRTRDGFQRA